MNNIMNNPYEFDINSNNKRKLQVDYTSIKKIKYSNKRKLNESQNPAKKLLLFEVKVEHYTTNK